MNEVSLLRNKEKIQSSGSLSACIDVNDCSEIDYFLKSTIPICSAVALTEAISSFKWPKQVQTMDTLQITDQELEHLTQIVALRILEKAKTPEATFPWLEEPKLADILQKSMPGVATKIINAISFGIFNETRRKDALKPCITFSSDELEYYLCGRIKNLSTKETSILTYVFKNLSNIFNLDEETLKIATLIGGAILVCDFKKLPNPVDLRDYEKYERDLRAIFETNPLPSILINK